MTIEAQLDDGRILEFPDGTDPAVIQDTVKRVLNVPEERPDAPPIPEIVRPALRPTEQPIPEGIGLGEQFARGAERGVLTVGRGLGLPIGPETPLEKAVFESIPDDLFAFTIGEIAGESAPFAPLAVIGPAAGITSLLARVGFTAALGATEGAIIARGKEGDIDDVAEAGAIGGTIGAAAEAFLPAILRGAGKLFRALGRKINTTLLTAEGLPTPEFQAALDETGTSFEDFTREALEETRRQAAGTDPAAVARLARLKSQGIPATAGDISQEFAQQAEEAKLISMASGEAGEPLRQLRLDQSEAFISGVNSLVDDLGVPKRAGDSIKDALTGRRTLLRAEKNALYKEAAEAAPEVANVPIFTDSIEGALPGPRELRRLSRLAGNQIDAVQDLLVEFGINKSDEAVAAFAETGGEIVPLNLGNFEEFRQAINLIERSDTTGAASIVTKKIKTALDEEASFIDDAVREAGVTDESIVGTLKEARKRVVQLKKEFSPQSITGRLIGSKRDGVTPVIEASKVTQELLRPNAPIENLERTLASLRKAKDGPRAIRDLQASVIMGALEDALKAPSRKTSGIETIGGNQFAKALDKFGIDKLEILFEGNERALNSLLNFKQTALDITPTAGAVPRGSAPVILDIVKRAGRLPGLAAIVDAVSFVATAGADDRAVRKALAAKPFIKKTLAGISKNFPALATTLGIPALIEARESE